MPSVFNRVNTPDDLKTLKPEELISLSAELRQYVIDEITRIGGHLGASLGVVELTVALHYIFDTPRDKIIWDVSHQAYIHKLLTGRKDRFHTIRQTDGLSGFCKIDESEYDAFCTGHASTSISAAVGMAIARDIQKQNHKVIAIIGDGALTGGLAFEALNHAGSLKKDLIVILNDNMMSISSNVGALSKHLTDLISNPLYNKVKKEIWEALGKFHDLGDKVRYGVAKLEEGIKTVLVPGHFFESLGFRYFGPMDGHDLPRLLRLFNDIKNIKGPLLLHVLTKKGKGMIQEERDVEKYKEDATRYHAVSAKSTSIETAFESRKSAPSYTEVFGKTLLKLCRKYPHVVGITAAMAEGTGLKYLADAIPQRFFDVGIAESHAVTMAAGMGLNGLKPVVAIYSTFIQRSFDQIVHDVALQNVPVLFCLDRAGLVGADGPTHHGALDLSFLRCIQGMTIMAPKDENELKDMIYTGILYNQGPIAIRYPRGNGVGVPILEEFSKIEIGKSEILVSGNDAAILAIGSMVSTASQAAARLLKAGYSVTVVNARFVKPLDEEMLFEIVRDHRIVITLEDNTIQGGFGSAVLEKIYCQKFIETHSRRDPQFAEKISRLTVHVMGLPDAFVEHGENEILYQRLGLDSEGVMQEIKSLIEAKGIRLKLTHTKEKPASIAQ